MSQSHEGNMQQIMGTAPKTPRWVKVLGVIALVLVLLMGILMLTGEHGPGRHMPPAAATVAGDTAGHSNAGQHGG